MSEASTMTGSAKTVAASSATANSTRSFPRAMRMGMASVLVLLAATYKFDMTRLNQFQGSTVEVVARATAKANTIIWKNNSIATQSTDYNPKRDKTGSILGSLAPNREGGTDSRSKITIVPPTKTVKTTNSAAKQASGSAMIDAEALQELAKNAQSFLDDRHAYYVGKNLTYQWSLRGVGYAWERHGVLLAAVVPSNTTLPGTPKEGRPTRQSVQIYNVGSNQTDCGKWTIWVRVNGPEIFAGAAVAVENLNKSGTTLQDRCYWTFDFDMAIPGEYLVDTKLLLWNGNAPIGGTTHSQCEYYPGRAPNSTQLKHDGFQGFKMYSPAQMCCEVCARTPFCVSWSTPFERLPEPNAIVNGCELFFEKDAPDSALPVSRLWPRIQQPLEHNDPAQNKGRLRRARRQLAASAEFHGSVHSNETSYFCGCGWSFWFTLDFQCANADLDDRVFTPHSTIMVSTASEQKTQVRDITLPKCTLANEQIGPASRGRWVRESWPEPGTCPTFQTVKGFDKELPLTQFDDNYPHCWHREDMTRIGSKCLEMNCLKIDKSSQWNSELHKETQFNGVWRPYECQYHEFSTEQLQECVTKKKIVEFITKGMSIASYLEQFLHMRLANITLYADRSDPEARYVRLDTLSLLHKNGPDGNMEQLVQQVPRQEANEEIYWVTGFFLSSEREVHTHVARMDAYNHILPEVLRPKKYKMINAFDMTAAFTYDAATQNDGMHIIGGPMKMIVTKFFHHVCNEVVQALQRDMRHDFRPLKTSQMTQFDFTNHGRNRRFLVFQVSWASRMYCQCIEYANQGGCQRLAQFQFF